MWDKRWKEGGRGGRVKKMRDEKRLVEEGHVAFHVRSDTINCTLF